jgi:predicted nucleic acid-binding protein
MTLADLPFGTRVAIDANILIYRKVSPECGAFLNQCASGDFAAAIPSVSLAEFCHRRMMIEAQALGSLGSNPAKRLAGKSELVRQLTIYSKEVRELLASGLHLLTIEAADFLTALEIQKRHGLLTNDSLLAAASLRHGISAIATADANFDSVTGLTIYKPTDI